MQDPDPYTSLEQNLAHFTRAIGHPARVAVLLAIARKGNKVHGEIIDVPPLSKATVLQHLRELKRAGLLQGRIFGMKAEYHLDIENLQKFNVLFQHFITSMSASDNPS